jgi:hypothetical protein
MSTYAGDVVIRSLQLDGALKVTAPEGTQLLGEKLYIS